MVVSVFVHEYEMNYLELSSKRDLKGFKCMTVSLDVLGDISRLIETFRISRLSNRKNFNYKYRKEHSNTL